MPKIDLKKEFKELYTAPKNYPVMVQVPRLNYLMIDGEGDPNTSLEYQQAMEALFPVSFKVKFLSKNEKDQDYVVMPLEGLWWVDTMDDFSIEDKSNWKWTAMILQPNFINESMIEIAKEDVEEKKNPEALSRMRFATLEEGLSAQIMHIGPYSEEEPTVATLHEFIEKEGYEFDGDIQNKRHHEIYLSDMRRTKPEKLRTIIRQPVK